MATSAPAAELRSVESGAVIKGVVTLLFTRSRTTRRVSTLPARLLAESGVSALVACGKAGKFERQTLEEARGGAGHGDSTTSTRVDRRHGHHQRRGGLRSAGGGAGGPLRRRRRDDQEAYQKRSARLLQQRRRAHPGDGSTTRPMTAPRRRQRGAAAGALHRAHHDRQGERQRVRLRPAQAGRAAPRAYICGSDAFSLPAYVSGSDGVSGSAALPASARWQGNRLVQVQVLGRRPAPVSTTTCCPRSSIARLTPTPSRCASTSGTRKTCSTCRWYGRPTGNAPPWLQRELLELARQLGLIDGASTRCPRWAPHPVRCCKAAGLGPGAAAQPHLRAAGPCRSGCRGVRPPGRLVSRG